ncbi:hypothetical protein QJS04_geneDACA004433 [Acorus gramineus]|uniref:Uncharacterized protein n=1 Tax=Acorus gramineus TaxID=55184 RepID=A0AAV9B3J6_ACOGR|nr:hypothetical protein QJS04_geneDACA004433 [Acorus gramineus]
MKNKLLQSLTFHSTTANPLSSPLELLLRLSQTLFSTMDRPSREHGFSRPEMNSLALAGTVDPYERHIFLCHRSPEHWPSRIELPPDADPLPSRLASAIKARKDDIPKKIRLTFCEGPDAQVLIFPDMVKYDGVGVGDVADFVDQVMVRMEGKWYSGEPPEKLTGCHVFVCCHGSRDVRCGVCGPELVQRLKEEIAAEGMADEVHVRACSHVGGHKYGYVTPDDVPVLVNEHIRKGKIVHRLWRGQMGLSVEQQKKIFEESLQETKDSIDMNAKEGIENGGSVDKVTNPESGCCQGVDGLTCCRQMSVEEKVGPLEIKTEVSDVAESGENKHEVSWKKGLKSISSWMEKFQNGETLAAIAVVGAVASVAMAYSFNRRSS